MSNPSEMIEYDHGLKNTIQELFIHKIVPSNFIYLIHKHDPKVLTDPDVRRVVKSIESKIDMEVNMEMLDLMTHYKGWFECLLKVLGDPALKQDDLIQHFKNLKDKFDKKWKAEKGGRENVGPKRGKKENKKNDIVPITGVPESGGKPAVPKESVRNSNVSSAQASLNEVKGQQKKAEAKVKGNEGGGAMASDSPKKESVAHSKNKKKVNSPLVQSASVSNLNIIQTGKGEVAKEKSAGSKPPLQSGQCSQDFCSICKAVLKSPQIAEAHYSGKKHQKNVEEEEKLKTSAQAKTSKTGPAAAAGVAVHRPENETLQADSVFTYNQIYTLNEKGKGLCHVCGVALTSQQNADDHLQGKGHRKKMETINSSKAK
ncbi:unnamed protein product [Lymnaea stagnalis]|uniref:U1-type domain-containing protein n=1 Tax=Lymnaea stagnalis TaxID=6523 RepID=A0AAV2IP86_LYMST